MTNKFLLSFVDDLISQNFNFVPRRPKLDATLMKPNVDARCGARHAPVKTPIETLMRPLNMHDRENDENPRVIMRFCQMMTVF